MPFPFELIWRIFAVLTVKSHHLAGIFLDSTIFKNSQVSFLPGKQLSWLYRTQQSTPYNARSWARIISLGGRLHPPRVPMKMREHRHGEPATGSAIPISSVHGSIEGSHHITKDIPHTSAKNFTSPVLCTNAETTIFKQSLLVQQEPWM